MKTVFYIALWFLLAFFCSKMRFFSKKKPWKDYVFILFKTVFFLKKMVLVNPVPIIYVGR